MHRQIYKISTGGDAVVAQAQAPRRLLHHTPYYQPVSFVSLAGVSSILVESKITFWPFWRPSRVQNPLFVSSCESQEADATSCIDRSIILQQAATPSPPKRKHHDVYCTTPYYQPVSFVSLAVVSSTLVESKITFWPFWRPSRVQNPLFVSACESQEADATSCPGRSKNYSQTQTATPSPPKHEHPDGDVLPALIFCY